MLTDDAVFVVPGMRLDRDAILASWDSVPPWQQVTLSDERVLQIGDDAVLVMYAANAARPDDVTYHAQFTTLYLRRSGQWSVAFHQQTPQPSPA